MDGGCFCYVGQVLEQLKRIFGEEALSPLSFSSHRWGEQPLTSANGGATGEGRDSMGDSLLRRAFVSWFKYFARYNNRRPVTLGTETVDISTLG